MNAGTPRSRWVIAATLVGIVLIWGDARGKSLEKGWGAFDFAFSQQGGRKVVNVRTYRSAAFNGQGIILFLMHGAGRDAEAQLRPWVERAERSAALLLAPEFSRDAFPGSRSYSLGGMAAGADNRRQAADTTFAVVDGIFDYVVKLTGHRRGSYRIYGHSGGAQFVHRLLLLRPAARIEAAAAANAGWYTMPHREAPFPYGLAMSGVTDGELRAALGKTLVVLLGENDTDQNHPLLRRSAPAMRQGEHRLERGRKFYLLAEKKARELGAAFAWRIEIVPRAGHANAPMAAAAAKYLLP